MKMFMMILVAAVQVLGVAAWNVKMSPDHVRVGLSPQTVTFTCAADSALARCQFSWWDVFIKAARRLLDLSRGPQSQADPAHLNDSVTGYSYTGRGLEAGDCGVSLQVEGYKLRIVGCRVRAEEGSWKYSWATMFADRDAPIPHNLTTPREVVVHPGGEARVSLKAQEPLDQCYFRLPPEYHFINFHHGTASRDSQGRHRYIGAGLESGECGLRMTRISEADNGLVRVAIQAPGVKSEVRLVPLIVTRPPTAPTLRLVYTDTNLTATCVSGASRPVAHVSWFMGNNRLRHDDDDDTQAGPKDTWLWPWVARSTQQTVTLELQPQDHGNSLRCRVDHVALDRPLEVSQTIASVSCPPLVPGLQTTVTCYNKGPEVNCNQPLPFGSWAEMACKPGFAPAGDVLHTRMNCTASAEWSQTVFDCHIDCGRRQSTGGEVLISGGSVAQKNEFPWHVAIYLMVNQTHLQICGGSLVSTKMVISAAHCFWDGVFARKWNATYHVAAGKHRREWNDAEDDDHVVQRRLVTQVILPVQYHGRQTNHQSDIALLVLSEEVLITAQVNLVCMDWEDTWLDQQNTTMEHRNNGTVAGWGVTEDGNQSDDLKYVNLPYIDHDTCYNALGTGLQAFVTHDKFCAGYANRSLSTCAGDSGGGLVFLNETSRKYFLRGINSIAFKPAGNKDRCYSQLYIGFTLVSDHNRWLKSHLRAHQQWPTAS